MTPLRSSAVQAVVCAAMIWAGCVVAATADPEPGRTAVTPPRPAVAASAKKPDKSVTPSKAPTDKRAEAPKGPPPVTFSAAEKALLLREAREAVKERESRSDALFGPRAKTSTSIAWVEITLAALIVTVIVLAFLQIRKMSALNRYIEAPAVPSREEWTELMALLTRQADTLRGLQQRVRDLEARDRPASYGPAGVAEPAPPRQPEPTQPPPPVRHSNEFDQHPAVLDILAAYARVIQYRDEEIRDFEQSYSPRSLRVAEPGSDEFLPEPASRTVWAVPVLSRWLLLPGPGPVTRWYNFQAAEGGTAKEVFGGAYDISRGEHELRIVRPAWAEEIGGRYRVLDRGVLAGVP